MDYYGNDFELEMLVDSAAFYSVKASNWIVEDSCPDYMLKASFFCSLFYQIVTVVWVSYNVFGA